MPMALEPAGGININQYMCVIFCSNCNKADCNSILMYVQTCK